MESVATQRILGAIENEFRLSERGAPVEGFPALPSIPVSRYRDVEFWNLEQQYLWPRSWLLAGHVDDVPEAGSYKQWNQSGVPVLLVRGKDGRIRAFYNACQHRGGPLAYEAQGKAPVISCKFHRWTYDLDGSLKFVPDEHEFPGLDKRSRGLKPLRCELWGNFIFVNRDPQAPSLETWLGQMVGDFRDFHMEQRRVYAKREYELPCSWKGAIEANQEAYHFAAVHPNTVHQAYDYRGVVNLLYRGGHSVSVTPYSQRAKAAFDVRDKVRLSDDPAHLLSRAGILSYSIFPNLVLPTGEFEFPIICFWPKGPGKTTMELYFTTPFDAETFNADVGQTVVDAFDMALDEDRATLTAVQNAYSLGLVDSVQFGRTEQRLYHFHEQIDKVIGARNMPDIYRITPLTEALVQDR